MNDYTRNEGLSQQPANTANANSGPPFGWEGWVTKGNAGLDDKFDEMSYFLARMKEPRSLSEFRWLTTAFLNAARATVDWIGHRIEYASWDEDGGHPDEDARARLSPYLTSKTMRDGRVFVMPVDPFLQRMSALRRIVAHSMPLWIDRLPGHQHEGDESGLAFAFVEFTGKFFAPGRPREAVLPFCDSVFHRLTEIKELL